MSKIQTKQKEDVIKIRAEIEFENRKQKRKINETKNWFFGKINKIDKHLASLIRKNRQRIQINKIIN